MQVRLGYLSRKRLAHKLKGRLTPPFFNSKDMFIQIFNKQLHGTDADKFLTWSCSVKKEWIKSNTNQQDDTLIDRFIKTVCKHELSGCGGCNNTGNVTSRIQPKAKQANQTSTSKPDAGVDKGKRS